ncbi:hypothetical protein ACFLSJ_00760 [Verrucomicrobiota bacterium]
MNGKERKDHQGHVDLRHEIRASAGNLLEAMDTGKIAPVEQVRTFCWDLIRFDTTPDYTAHKLDCIRSRMKELGAGPPEDYAAEAKQFIARLKAEALDAGDAVEADMGISIGETPADPKFPHGPLVWLIGNIGTNIEDLGLSILAKCRVRDAVFPIINTNRVEDPDELKVVPPDLRGGNDEAIRYAQALEPLLEDCGDGENKTTQLYASVITTEAFKKTA